MYYETVFLFESLGCLVTFTSTLDFDARFAVLLQTYSKYFIDE